MTTEKKPAQAAAEKKPAQAVADDEFGPSISEPDIDAWYNPEFAPLIEGQIVGHKVLTEVEKGKKVKRDVVVMLLSKPCQVKGQDGKPVTVEAGKFLGIGIRFKLIPLLEYVENKGIVRVVAIGKENIGGGHTMWKFDINPHKTAKRGAPPKAAVSTSEDIETDVDPGDADDFQGS